MLRSLLRLTWCSHSSAVYRQMIWGILLLLQVLTHVKEKLQYIEKENEALQVSSICLPSLGRLVCVASACWVIC